MRTENIIPVFPVPAGSYVVSERKNLRILKAEVPLSEVFNYADILRNLTQGRAPYTIEPSYYEKVPPELMVKILGV